MTRLLRHLAAGLRALSGRGRDERALRDEYDAFVAEAVAAKMASGMSAVDTPVVISDRLFRAWFDRDAARALGARVTMAGQRLTVIGVAPAAFMGTWLPTMMRGDVWLPAAAGLRFSTIQGVRQGDQPLRSFLWLTPAASRDRVKAAIETIGRAMAGGDSGRGTMTVIAAERAILFDAFRKPGQIAGAFFIGLSLLVFLTACANLTNLVLARATSRSGEIAVRLAMGAGRWRVARLLAIEVLLVSALAGVVALGVMYGFTTIMTKVPLPRLDLIAPTFDPTPDVRVFACAMATAILAALVVGVAPAWRVAGTAPMTSLKPGGFGGSSRRGARARSVMVGLQVALSTVLLVMAGLLGRSALASTQFDPGYDTSRAATAIVNLDLHRYDDTRGRQFQERVLEEARRVPGVERAMLASGLRPAALPLNPTGLLRLEGDSHDIRTYSRLVVSAGLFEALGVRVEAGREFVASDRNGAPRVALISRALADQLGIADHAVGRRLTIGEESAFEIVGVIEDLRAYPRAPDYVLPLLVLPATQQYVSRMAVIVTGAAPAQFVEPLRRAIRAVDPEVAVVDVRLLSAPNDMMTEGHRVGGLVVAALGALGLAIALVGLYGVLAFVISQRTREFGIRRALGATSGRIYRIVVTSGLWMAGIGAVAGIALALVTTPLLTRFLHPDISPYDIVTLVVVTGFLFATAAAGSALAARRAARVDPNVALRDL